MTRIGFVLIIIVRFVSREPLIHTNLKSTRAHLGVTRIDFRTVIIGLFLFGEPINLVRHHYQTQSLLRTTPHPMAISTGSCCLILDEKMNPKMVTRLIEYASGCKTQIENTNQGR